MFGCVAGCGLRVVRWMFGCVAGLGWPGHLGWVTGARSASPTVHSGAPQALNGSRIREGNRSHRFPMSTPPACSDVRRSRVQTPATATRRTTSMFYLREVRVLSGPWQGEPESKSNCVTARWGGKEALGEVPTRGTRIASGGRAWVSQRCMVKPDTCSEGAEVHAAGAGRRKWHLSGEVCRRVLRDYRPGNGPGCDGRSQQRPEDRFAPVEGPNRSSR